MGLKETEQEEKQDNQGKSGFDNVIEIPVRNGKQELVILFPTVTNSISHSLSAILVTTLNTFKKSKCAILLFKSK
jgi:hypothetical protein